jgi:Glyoxalase/Bleomycin resistance protein/Dioxygenase superfamily
MSLTPHPTSICHRTLLVEDLEATAETLAETLSVQWNVWMIQPDYCTVRGVDTPFMFKMAFARHAGARMELIAPMNGASMYAEYLQKRGEGLALNCYTFPDLQALKNAQKDLIAKGFALVQQAITQGLFEFCLFESHDGEELVELLHIRSLAAPDRTIN